MSRIYRNSDTGYFPTEGLRDRIKKSRNPAQPGTGSRIVKYARRPFVPGLGLLYHIGLNRDGSSTGWLQGNLYRLISYDSPDSIIRVPEGTTVYVTPVFYHARFDSGAWSGTGSDHSLRYRLRATSETLIESSKLLNQLFDCEPINTNIFARTFIPPEIYTRELSGSLTNFNFHLDRINRPTSVTSCNQSQFRAGFYIRLKGITDEGDVTINEAAFDGIQSVSLVEEVSFIIPPPPPAPTITKTETASETIRVACFSEVSYIKQYDWFLDGDFAKTTKDNKTVFQGLVNRQEYVVAVKAVDERGEESEISATEKATPEDPEIIYTDFSEYENTTFPSGWKDIWTLADQWLVRTGQGDEWDGNAYLRHNQSSDGHYGIIWESEGEYADFELLTGLSPDSGFSTKYEGRVLFRCSDSDNTAKTCYEVAFHGNGNVHLRRWLNNSVTILDSVGFPTSISPNIYMVRLIVVGSSIKCKLWHKNDDEPADWTIEVEDDSISQGFFGFAGFAGGSGTAGLIEFDSVELKAIQP